MFLIDREKKMAEEIPSKSFSELGLYERQDLQEWISNNPKMLGESLLIIQKEFSGFSDTNERLDLLALDSDGNIVVIENKLDDSGKDVVWQSLKYVSYCAPLTTNEITEIYQKYLGGTGIASERICEFLGEEDFESVKLNTGNQRIFLVAANFRKEVTATVLYLNERLLDIKCIKVTPYVDQERLYLDVEQILPVQDAIDYQVRLNAKKQEDAAIRKTESNTKAINREFWERSIPIISQKNPIYKNRTTTSDSWLGGSSGYSGIGFNLIARQKVCAIELYIDIGLQEKNKEIFDQIYQMKDEIETITGFEITWRRLPEKRASRILVINEDFNLTDPDTWEKSIYWLSNSMEIFHRTFKEKLDKVMKNVSK